MNVSYVILLAWSFALSNTNSTAYTYHAEAFSSYNGPITSTFVDYNSDLTVRCDMQFNYYGDLYFSINQDNTYSWVLSLRTVGYEVTTYVATGNSDFTQLPIYNGSWGATSYDTNNPLNNEYYVTSDNPASLNWYNWQLVIDMTEPEVDVTYGYDSDHVWIDNSHSLPLSDFSTGYYINSTAVVYFELSNVVTSYIDSVTGNNASYGSGYSNGFSEGESQGYANGYTDGYNNGVSDTISTNNTALTIFNGILNIALVPINFFLAIFNFEILGINLTEFVGALLSICCVIILLRVVFSGGNKGGKD